jgi:hypothetical protein
LVFGIWHLLAVSFPSALPVCLMPLCPFLI